MTRIVWDKVGERTYETGADHGVLYPQDNKGLYDHGVPWNGLISVSESPSGAEASAQYADNIKYLNLVSAEEFGATIEAFSYPPEFAECDGSASPVQGLVIGQQSRKAFGLSYRTLVGNDTDGTSYGYKLHLLYGCLAAPSDRTYNTVNDSPEAMQFSWEITTSPVEVGFGLKPSASLTLDSTLIDPDALKKIEDILYGDEDADPRLPLPGEVVEILGASTTFPDLRITPSLREGLPAFNWDSVADSSVGHLEFVRFLTPLADGTGDEKVKVDKIWDLSPSATEIVDSDLPDDDEHRTPSYSLGYYDKLGNIIPMSWKGRSYKFDLTNDEIWINTQDGAHKWTEADTRAGSLPTPDSDILAEAVVVADGPFHQRVALPDSPATRPIDDTSQIPDFYADAPPRVPDVPAQYTAQEQTAAHEAMAQARAAEARAAQAVRNVTHIRR